MASSSSASGSAGSGSGRTPGPPKSLAQQFFDHRLLSRSNIGKPLPTPLDMEKYDKDIPPRQTNLCLKMAVEFYNVQPDSKRRLKLEHVVGIRSSLFILDNIDPVCYFHLYFKREARQLKRYYFAELEGKGGPERVRVCREIDKKTASAVNCEHCFGGILHPPDGFIGQRPAPVIGYRLD